MLRVQNDVGPFSKLTPELWLQCLKEFVPPKILPGVQIHRDELLYNKDSHIPKWLLSLRLTCSQFRDILDSSCLWSTINLDTPHYDDHNVVTSISPRMALCRSGSEKLEVVVKLSSHPATMDLEYVLDTAIDRIKALQLCDAIAMPELKLFEGRAFTELKFLHIEAGWTSMHSSTSCGPDVDARWGWYSWEGSSPVNETSDLPLDGICDVSSSWWGATSSSSVDSLGWENSGSSVVVSQGLETLREFWEGVENLGNFPPPGLASENVHQPGLVLRTRNSPTLRLTRWNTPNLQYLGVQGMSVCLKSITTSIPDFSSLVEVHLTNFGTEFELSRLFKCPALKVLVLKKGGLEKWGEGQGLMWRDLQVLHLEQVDTVQEFRNASAQGNLLPNGYQVEGRRTREGREINPTTPGAWRCRKPVRAVIVGGKKCVAKGIGKVQLPAVPLEPLLPWDSEDPRRNHNWEGPDGSSLFVLLRSLASCNIQSVQRLYLHCGFTATFPAHEIASFISLFSEGVFDNISIGTEYLRGESRSGTSFDVGSWFFGVHPLMVIGKFPSCTTIHLNQVSHQCLPLLAGNLETVEMIVVAQPRTSYNPDYPSTSERLLFLHQLMQLLSEAESGAVMRHIHFGVLPPDEIRYGMVDQRWWPERSESQQPGDIWPLRGAGDHHASVAHVSIQARGLTLTSDEEADRDWGKQLFEYVAGSFLLGSVTFQDSSIQVSSYE